MGQNTDNFGNIQERSRWIGGGIRMSSMAYMGSMVDKIYLPGWLYSILSLTILDVNISFHIGRNGNSKEKILAKLNYEFNW